MAVVDFSKGGLTVLLARQLGYSIAETPVRWAHQEGSKVRFVRDAVRMLKTLFRIRATDYQLTHAGYKRSSAP